MRLPESKIKSAILHPNEDVRLTAVGYFSDAYSEDQTVMPLVIEAVEKYGRDCAFRILRDAERLHQTEETVKWLSSELRRDYNTKEIAEDNYRCAVAISLCQAQVGLLSISFCDLPSFPNEMKEIVTERLEMASWDLETAWKALESFGLDTMRRNEFTQADIRRAQRIMETLAQYPNERADMVLCLLRREYPPGNDQLMQWLDPLIIELAGEMRLQQAIPILMERLNEEYMEVVDAAITALSKIGGDAVVEAVSDEWRESDFEWQDTVADVLEHIHTDLCVEKCIEYFDEDEEEEPDVQISLANALLAHFTADAIEPVRQLVLGDEDDLEPDERDVRYRLLAVATVMGETFPEYDEWYQVALENNWGWGDYKPGRLADAFRRHQIGQPHLGNGKA